MSKAFLVVEQPLIERTFQKRFEATLQIGVVSKAVQDMYEENPYPTWSITHAWIGWAGTSTGLIFQAAQPTSTC